MPLPKLIDALIAYLGSEVPTPLTELGGVRPTDALQLPAVVLSVGSARARLAGIGNMPRVLAATDGGTALPVSSTIDLADPVLRFTDDSVELLSSDRRVLQMPHSPLVTQSGGEPPIPASDLTISVAGAPISLVTGTPTAGEASVQPAAATLTFGEPLPPTGELALTYYIGRWDVRARRFDGELTLEVVAATAAEVDGISREVAAVLEPERATAVTGVLRLSPLSWGAVGPVSAGLPTALSQALRYRVEYEHQEPIIPTGGGLIATVAVDSTFGPEDFQVPPVSGAP